MQAEYDAGSGTFVKDTFICASLVGVKHVVPPASAADLVRDELMFPAAVGEGLGRSDAGRRLEGSCRC